MKSIMEEASTIFKAVEKGWTRAGKPEEFSVKVYEEPEHNFLGLTTKPAKIGIFFTDKQKTVKRSDAVQEKQKSASNKAKAKKKTAQNTAPTVPEKPAKKIPKDSKKQAKELKTEITKPVTISEKAEQTEQQKKKEKIVKKPWTNEMVQFVKKNITQTLQLAQISADFSIDVQHLHLKVIFDTQLFDNQQRQKQFFASTATLIMQALKKRYKRPLKGYKIILQIA